MSYYDPNKPSYYNPPPPGPGGQHFYPPPEYPPPASVYNYPSPQPQFPAQDLPEFPSHHANPMPIPEDPQNFHHQLGSQYQFQYSQCNGKKKVISPSYELIFLGASNWDQLYRFAE